MPVNKTFAGTFVVAISALILMLAGFSVPQWQDRVTTTVQTSGNVDTVTVLIGLSTWEYTFESERENGDLISSLSLEGALATDGEITRTYVTTTPTPSTNIDTIRPPDSTNFYQQQGVATLLEDSISARNNLIGTGVVAFILGIVFCVLLGLAQGGKGYTWFRPVSVLVCVLTAVMTFVGVFLYSKVLNIGYSFIIWAGFAIFALLGGIFALAPSPGNKGRFLPLVCVVLALGLGIAAMSTTYWYSEMEDQGTPRVVTTSHAGVKAYSVLVENYAADGTTIESTREISSSFGSDTFRRKQTETNPPSSSEQEYDKCPDTILGPNFCYEPTLLENGRFKDFISGGEQALGCGIPGLLFLVIAGAAMVTLMQATPPAHAQKIAVALSFIASAFGFLALFLFAAVSSVGASFVIYSAAAFLWVLASCMAFNLLNASKTTA